MLTTPLLFILEPDTDEQAQLVNTFESARVSAEFRFVSTEEELLSLLSDQNNSITHRDKRRGVIMLAMDLFRKDTYRIIKHLKTHSDYAHIPLVIMSKTFSASQLEEAYRLGVNSVVHKPLRNVSMIKIMEIFDEYWFEHVSLPRINQ